MNRKWIALLLSCALVLMLATACGRNNDKGNTNANTPSNNGAGNTNNNDMGNSGNTNVPGNMTPGNADTGMGGTGMSGDNQNDGNIGEHNDPVFPDSLATMDADVAIADLFDTIGLTETDLDNAMRDIATVGDGVDGARTYRHKLLGEDADVSYGFDDSRTINKVTVNAKPTTADQWRTELKDTLGAKAVDGETDTWTYDDNQIKIDDQGTHVVITIEKKA